jgi:hypothetical protein
VSLDWTRVNLDWTRVNLDCTRVNLDWMRVNLDWTRVNLDWTRVNLDCTRVNLDWTRANLDWTRANLDWTRVNLRSTRKNQRRLAYRLNRDAGAFHGSRRVGSFSSSCGESVVRRAPLAIATSGATSMTTGVSSLWVATPLSRVAGVRVGHAR